MRFFTSKYSGWLWGLPTFLFSSYWGLFSRLSHQGMKLITHIHLVLKFRMHGAISPLPYMPS